MRDDPNFTLKSAVFAVIQFTVIVGPSTMIITPTQK